MEAFFEDVKELHIEPCEGWTESDKPQVTVHIELIQVHSTNDDDTLLVSLIR